MSEQKDNTQELTEERIREIVREEIEVWWGEQIPCPSVIEFLDPFGGLKTTGLGHSHELGEPH